MSGNTHSCNISLYDSQLLRYEKVQPHRATTSTAEQSDHILLGEHFSLVNYA